MTAAVLVASTTLAVAVPSADAARRPTRAEATAIERVALRACERAAPDDCRFGRARVSTSNRRYAWAEVVGTGFSAVLLKRPSARSHRFSVAGIQGGGIGECSYWRRRAPRAVLRDLRIDGVIDDQGTTARCG